jgi:transcriptional regulator with XRE-family HTH domain
LRKDIGIRFKQFREHLQLLQKELAQKMGLYQSAISQIESGVIFPSFSTIIFLAHTFRLNASWLITGEGDMFLHTADTLSEIRDDGKLDENYIRLLKAIKDPRVEKVIFANLTEALVYLGIDI